MRKRVLSMILVIVMCLTLLPVGAFAATVVDSGKCGDNLTWTLDSENVLTISGTGEMYDYFYSPDSLPWYFYQTHIKSAVIGNGVTSIDDFAFYNCSSLTSVKIPDSVTSIDSYTFTECSSLESINVSANNKNYTSVDGVLFSKDMKTLFRCPERRSGAYSIPDSVRSIGFMAFAGCSRLASVKIPDSVTSIDSYAFEKCSSLTSVMIPDSVTSIGSDVFRECSSLESINVSANNKYYTSVNGVLFSKDKKTLISCPKGKSGAYSIPDSVTSIGDYAFSGCSCLTSVKIPNSVTSIGEYAFSGCSCLTSMTIPDSVKSIEYYAFEGTALYNNSSNWENGVLYIGKHLIAAKADITSCDIKNGTICISDYTFLYCYNLSSVTIPSSVVSIGNWVFDGCSRLESITVSANNKNYISVDGVLFSKDKKTLIRCPARKSGAYVIPDSVTSICDYAFSYCSRLTSVKIPSSVTSIGSDAFRECSSLESVKMPSGVKSIGDSVFKGCSSLESVTIPDSVTSIGGWVFEGTALYNNSSNWENGVLYIGNHLIAAKTDITSCTIKNGTICIGGYAFYNCDSLSSVTIPSSVKGIGSGAFRECSSLESVTIPSSVTSMGIWVFLGCENLKSVTITGSVTSIGKSSFLGCSDLKSVTIPSSVKSIDDYAFNACKSLKDVYYTGSEAQWKKISIGGANDVLGDATIHYNWNGDVKPAKPTVTVSTVTSSGKIKLTWKAVTGAAKYEVYRATSSGGTYKKLTTTTNTSYTNTSATAGTKYYYKVRALSASGTAGSYSSVVSLTCDCAKPVITLSNNTTTGKNIVKWSKIDGAAKYEVYRATSKSGTYSKLTSTTSLSYTDTTAKAGSTYYYKVKAIGKTTAANSAYSEIVSRTCDCAKPVITLSNVSSTGKIKVSWSKIDGAAKYEVYRATSSSGTYKKLTTTTSTSYTDTTAKAGTKYYYKVKAIAKTSAANSAYSAVKNIVCDLAKPVVKITTSKGDPKLSWSKITGAAKYEVYRATSKSGTYSKLTSTTKLTYTNTSAKAGKTYYYKVKAVCGTSAAASAYSSVVSIKAK